MHSSLKALLAGSAALTLISTATIAATTNPYVYNRYTVNDNQADGWRPSSVGSIDFAGMTLEFTGTGSFCAGGCSSSANWYYPDGNPDYVIEGLDAFALVGKWGTSTAFSSTYGSVFQIGTSLTIVAPSAQPAHLFLGINDSYFADNSGGYFASIDYAATALTAPVPLPAGGVLMVSAMAAGAMVRRRKG